MPEAVIVLVRPQLGENIGAAARAMANFGLGEMRLVSPRDGWPNPAAVRMASGAGGVLDRAGVFATTAEAIADCTAVYATTARGRDLAKRVLAPETAVAEARAGAGRVALVFGPERTGLENDDIARATALVSVPVDPAFPSLNLAQCVLLMAYEWRRAGPLPIASDGPEPAPAVMLERLADHAEADLDAAGYFFPTTKASAMKLTLRNMWPRLGLGEADVQVLHGILRQLARSRDFPS